MINTNYLIGIAFVCGIIATMAFFYVKNKFFARKLAPAAEIRKELRECNKRLMDTNKTIMELHAFFKDLESKGM